MTHRISPWRGSSDEPATIAATVGYEGKSAGYNAFSYDSAFLNANYHALLGRGVYFEDPSGHLLEILTRPYGSGGTTAANPHPLVAEKLEPNDAG